MKRTQGNMQATGATTSPEAISLVKSTKWAATPSRRWKPTRWHRIGKMSEDPSGFLKRGMYVERFDRTWDIRLTPERVRLHNSKEGSLMVGRKSYRFIVLGDGNAVHKRHVQSVVRGRDRQEHEA